MDIRNSGSSRALACACLVVLAACSAGDSPAPPADDGRTTGLLPPAAPPGDCIDGGSLSVELYGAVAGEFEWRGEQLSCEGMPRPEGRGARLRFAGDPGEGLESIALIIAIPDLVRGETSAELSTNVTLIEEGQGRFFSTPDLEHCWTDVERQSPSDRGGEVYEIDGAVYCIGPLGEVSGSSSVTIERLEFRGIVDWNAG